MKFERPKSFDEGSLIEQSGFEQEQGLEFRQFLAKQVSLPSKEWDGKFKEYVREKYEESQREILERTAEEERDLTFERYLKGLDLTEEDLRNKKILDLGCGEEGEFVKSCFEKGITQEIYGLDAQIKPRRIESEYKEHFFRGNFEKKIPLKELDYVIAVGAIKAPWNEGVKLNPKKTLLLSLSSIKEGGEIRIYPLQTPSSESDLEGIKFANKEWTRILEELEKEIGIEWERRPIDIMVSGRRPDVWLEEVLIIRKEFQQSTSVLSEEKTKKN